MQVPALERPFRDELLSIERLEERALTAAADFIVDPDPNRKPRNIFSRFHEKILAGDQSSQLTAREIEVVRWTSEGKTSAEIAIILGLSEHTVISHITSSARKLNAVNRVHMIAIAVRRGIVT